MALDITWWEDSDLPLPTPDLLDMSDTLANILQLRGDFERQFVEFRKTVEGNPEWSRKKASVFTYIDVSLKFCVNAEVRATMEAVLMSMKGEGLDASDIERSLKIAEREDRNAANIDPSTRSLNTFEKMNEAIKNSSLFKPDKKDTNPE